MSDYEFLALEGGGAKGVIYLGVAQALQKLGVLKDIKAISGASAGAISALVLATGWPVEKMQQILDGLDFEQMASGGFWGNLTVPITELKHFGFHDGKAFYEFFKKIVKAVTGDENATFETWHKLKEEHPELGLKDISIQACNLNTKENETFAWNTQHKNVPIADAVRASMGFPGYFTPWEIKGFLYSDGGIQKNCPSDVFEAEPGVYNPKVLSVKLETFDQIKYFEKGIPLPATPIKTPLQCAVAQFEAALNVQDNVFLTSPYKKTTVLCDTLNIGTLQFDLTDNQKQALEASGEYGIIRYFYKLHPEIVEKHYDPETLERIKASDFTECFTEFMKTQKAPEEKYVSASSTEDGDLPGNVVRLHIQPQKSSTTPLFHQWSKNTAIRTECERLASLELQHKERRTKTIMGF